MGTAVAQLIPVALGFALSPIPLVEMVLILFSRRALTNGLVFLACIMLPVFLIPFLGAAGQDAAATTTSERSTAQGIILIAAAAVLLAIAWRNFCARHSTSVPKVFGKIEGRPTAGTRSRRRATRHLGLAGHVRDPFSSIRRAQTGSLPPLRMNAYTSW